MAHTLPVDFTKCWGTGLLGIRAWVNGYKKRSCLVGYGLFLLSVAESWGLIIRDLWVLVAGLPVVASPYSLYTLGLSL